MPSPNPNLKHERNLRSWSQGYLADLLGVPNFYISRWESGKHAPSPYYQQKLCEIFGKTAEELGFLASSSQPDEKPGPAKTAEELDLPTSSSQPDEKPGPARTEPDRKNTDHESFSPPIVQPLPESIQKKAGGSCRRILVILLYLLLLLGGGWIIRRIGTRQRNL